MKYLHLIKLLAASLVLVALNYSCDKDSDLGKENIVLDIDGNKYKTITIGSQVWMVENLKTTRYSNGDPIPIITDALQWKEKSSGAYCNYDNNEENCKLYGRLYNWHAVNDPRKLAPVGWRIPTKYDWEILENYLIDNGFNFDGTTTGSKFAKSLASSSGWEITTVEGSIGANQKSNNNSTGFSAYPSGFRNDVTFNGKGLNCSWWSSSNYNNNGAYFCYLFYLSNYMTMTFGMSNSGFSVRCIK